MKILLINCVLGYGSTGKIALNIAKQYDTEGNTVKIAYSRDPLPKEAKKYAVKIGSKADTYLHALNTRATDKHGLSSISATKKFLKWAEDYNPDLLWLHNIHGYYINYELLFDWIKKRPDMKVKWTLHDCWPFTGHCAYFTYAGCNKWKNGEGGCNNCPQSGEYPKSFKDNSVGNFERKKAAFTGVKNLTIITPSEWLKEIVEKSFLCEYPVEVVYNKINTDVFKPTDNKFREEHGLTDKKILLGVANIWEPRKGLDDYIKLSKELESKEIKLKHNLKEEYKIVLVGLKSKQIKEIKDKNISILALPKTDSAKELAGIYTAADYLVNLTKEDNYPTVNLEAESCGIPVITYDTGGSRETIKREDSIAVKSDTEEILKELAKREAGDGQKS